MALAATPVRLPGRDNLEFQVFAVFDGHSGDKTAKFCKKNLVKELLPRLPDTQMPSEDNKAAFEVNIQTIERGPPMPIALLPNVFPRLNLISTMSQF